MLTQYILLQDTFHEQLNQQKWKSALEICENLIAQAKILQKSDETSQWKTQFEFIQNQISQEALEQYQNLRNKINLVNKFQNWEEGVDFCDQIIELLPHLNKNEEKDGFLKLQYQFEQELKQEQTQEDYSYYDKVDIDQYENGEVKLKDYPTLLRKANTIESKKRSESKAILLRCLAMIKANEIIFLEEYPKRTNDRIILENRLKKRRSNK